MRTIATAVVSGLLAGALYVLPVQAHDPDGHHHSVEFGFYAICQMTGHARGTAEWDACIATERARVDQRLAELRDDFLRDCRDAEGHPPDSAALRECVARKSVRAREALHRDIKAIQTNPSLDRHPRLREAVAGACAEPEGAEGTGGAEDAQGGREMCLFRETLSYRNRAEAIARILDQAPALEER